MKQITFSLMLFFIATLLLPSCTENSIQQENDSFDRSQMLIFWADEIIIPSILDLENKLIALQDAKDSFLIFQSEENLINLRTSWLESYKSWQRVSMFEIGKAEELGLRNYMNIFPTNTFLIQQNIEDEDVNLELPSNFSAQGFPALDYLLFGIGNDISEIVAVLGEPKHSFYLSLLVDRMHSLVAQVRNSWSNGFRNEFIANSGSSATASTDKMVNDFLLYYEKYFRAGKVGIPAGVFTGDPDALLVEAPYASNVNKILFSEAFSAIQAFFIGYSFDGSKNGVSLQDYLIDLNTNYGLDNNVSQSILDQWFNVNNKLSEIDDDFSKQIDSDPDKMLELYDEIHEAVVPLKVEMMQLMNIQVDFVDADGD